MTDRKLRRSIRSGKAFALVLIIAAAATGALSVRQALLPPPGERPELGVRIQTAAAALGDGEALDINNFTNFTWQRLIVLPAYAPDSVARQALGFEWPAERLPSSDNDAWTTLIFADDGRVVAWCQLESSRVNFHSELYAGPLVVAASQARFLGHYGADGVVELKLSEGSP